MESLMKSDIFFFITSLVVIVLGVGGVFLTLQVYWLLKEIREIARHTRQASEWLLEDFDEMRDAIKEKGIRLRFFLNFFRGLFERKIYARRTSRKSKARVEQEEDTDSELSE